MVLRKICLVRNYLSWKSFYYLPLTIINVTYNIITLIFCKFSVDDALYNFSIFNFHSISFIWISQRPTAGSAFISPVRASSSSAIRTVSRANFRGPLSNKLRTHTCHGKAKPRERSRCGITQASLLFVARRSPLHYFRLLRGS